MKKLVAMVLAMALAFSLAACGGSDGSSAAAGGSSAAAGGSSAVGAAAGSSGKIAVIRQLANSDHTTQFFAGCIAEGEALGYTVDTFTADGDDVKMQDLMEQALQKGYDIWIVSHANEGYQYDLVSRAVEKGVKVVGFDCGGEHVEGVTYTSQDDEALASISLDGLIAGAKEKGANRAGQVP